MAVSKRLRYEILRRDNYACRYCGKSSTDATLTVDHVVPTALGGEDTASNLVAACADCNAGKSSTIPDAPLVQDVASDALRWSQAMTRAAEQQRNRAAEVEQVKQALYMDWLHTFELDLAAEHEPDRDWRWGDSDRTYEWVIYSFKDGEGHPIFLADTQEEADQWIEERNRDVIPPLPDDWDASVPAWMAAGINLDDIGHAVQVAHDATHVSRSSRYRYFCGVIWNLIEERQEIARSLIELDEGDG